jgi:hypothetical protein
MEYTMIRANVFVLALALIWALTLAAPVTAQTIVQWNFNSPVADANVGSGVMTPSIPTNPASISLLGGVQSTFQSGDSETGSSDPNTGDDSALQVTGFPAQGTASATAGVQFNVSTVGFSNIQIVFDIRFSSTSSKVIQLYYSTNGTTFIAATPTLTATQGGERWYLQRSANLSAITAANNNPNFKFKIVSVFDPSVGASYSGAGGVYDPAGALRFDMVTVTGTPTAAIPPSGVATASPAVVCSTGGQILFRVPVNRGVNPNSTTLAVRADLTSLGGSASQSLFDNGTNGDSTPNDRIFNLMYTVPAGVIPGPRTIPITITDAQSRTGTASVVVNVADCSTNSGSRVVISQIYGGGGNTPPPASAYNVDFIEIYNRSALPVDLTGWSVQYADPIDPLGFFDPRESALLSGSIKPGQYMLIRCTVPNSLGAPAPDADFVFREPIGIGHTGGKVALVRTSTLLGAACTRADVEDFVGYGGAAACFEGIGPTGTVDNDTAVVRKLGGAQDTDQSFNDFTVTTPFPHNRSFGGNLAGYGSLSAPGVCAGASVTISVQVAGAANPTSTGVQVSANLSQIGGSAAQSLLDSGAGIFTLTYLVPGAVSPGVKAIPIAVSDAQGRTDSSSLSLTVGTCIPASSRVVISAFYAGSGKVNSLFTADFVELFNRSQAPVTITGWTLQYANADTPAGFDALQQIPLSGVIVPGKCLLVQTSGLSTTGAALPTPDVVGTLLLNNEFGRLALVTNAVPLGANCTLGTVEDFVGYGGSAICYEGVAPTIKLTNEQAARRREGGCQDFNQNLIDFDVTSASMLPRNAASPANVCPVVSITGACCTGISCAVVAQGSCAGVFGGPATACNFPGNPVTCCPANFNGVDGITVQDIFDYLNAWFAGDPRADFNHLDGISVQDIFDYLNAWFAGCP